MSNMLYPFISQVATIVPLKILAAEVLHTELPKTGDQQPVLKVPNSRFGG